MQKNKLKQKRYNKKIIKCKKPKQSKIDIQKYKSVYNEILNLYDTYNFTDMVDILKQKNISSNMFHNVIKYYKLQKNPIFIPITKTSLVKYIKNILKTDKSVTYDDYNTVKDIIYNHLYIDEMLPSDIIKLYNIDSKPDNFSHFITKNLKIKLHSISYSLKTFHKNKGTYDDKTNKELYYNDCSFNFPLCLYPNIIGYELISKYGWYSSSKNKNGVSRDHRISRFYGWENNINPKLISHPANCEIMIMNKNSSKNKKCSITIEELKEQIKEWDKKYGIYNQEIYDKHLLD